MYKIEYASMQIYAIYISPLPVAAEQCAMSSLQSSAKETVCAYVATCRNIFLLVSVGAGVLIAFILIIFGSAVPVYACLQYSNKKYSTV